MQLTYPHTHRMARNQSPARTILGTYVSKVLYQIQHTGGKITEISCGSSRSLQSREKKASVLFFEVNTGDGNRKSNAQHSQPCMSVKALFSLKGHEQGIRLHMGWGVGS